MNRRQFLCLAFAGLLCVPFLKPLHAQPGTTVASYALNTAANTTPEIPFDGRGGVIFVPVGSSITSLTYYAAEKVGGTYLPLYQADGATPVTQTVTSGKAYDMPPQVFGCRAIKIVVNTAGSVFITQKG